MKLGRESYKEGVEGVFIPLHPEASHWPVKFRSFRNKVLETPQLLESLHLSYRISGKTLVSTQS
jgi:hypothetical protein